MEYVEHEEFAPVREHGAGGGITEGTVVIRFSDLQPYCENVIK